MKKKFVSLLLVSALAVSMTACGSSGKSDNAKSTTSASVEKDTDTYRIGICQLLEHEALDAATKGFKDALTEKLGDKVIFDEQNAQGEATNCGTICNKFVSNDVDLILANATGALQAASSATDQIPILGTSITDYATALGMKDFTGSTGKNISGTSDIAPLDQQAAMIKELVPDVTQVGILYCSAEPNSKYQAVQIEKYLDKEGIAYKEYTAADSNEIQSATTNACSECDALYVPTDNTMAASVDVIKNIAIPAKVPMIAGEQGICDGGIATLSINYYDLGYETGEMAYEILVNGADIKTMEIKTAPKTTKMYNKANCEALGITVPEGYEPLPEE